METRLPKYSEYLDSLKLYAKALKIKVEYKHGDFEGGEYHHHVRVLRLEPDLSESQEIACFLHELGHAFDESACDYNYVKNLSKAYLAFYEDRATPLQVAGVLKCEREAWRYAEIIAKLLKIKLGKWFYKNKKYFLEGYEKYENT
jgi:hypothetical protein